MGKNIRQGVLIKRLNDYLTWHNLSVRMNKGGICNGLATVYAKYVLNNKEQQFEALLEKISTQEASAPMDPEVNQFITDVLLSFLPQKFNKELNQFNSMEALSANGRKMMSSFNFSLSASNHHWEKIFASLDLQPGEVVKITGINHAISVTKTETGFTLYDPNEPAGSQTVNDISELVYRLGVALFYENKNKPIQKTVNLGFTLQIMCPGTEEKQRSFPDPQSLYEQYLQPNHFSPNILSDSQFHTLDTTAVYADSHLMRYLLQKENHTENELHSAALKAVYANNPEALNILACEINEISSIRSLFEAAISDGRLQSYQALINIKHCNQVFYGYDNDSNFANNILKQASGSGNPELLKEILERHIVPTDVGVIRDAFKNAVASGNASCVKQLYNTFKTEIDSSNIELYFKLAIDKNKPFVFNQLCRTWPEHTSLADIKLTVEETQRTDIKILNRLQEHGYSFNPMQQKIIAEKAHRPVSLTTKAGVVLYHFTDFLTAQVQKAKTAFDNFKERLKSSHASRETSVMTPLNTIETDNNNDDDEEEEEEDNDIDWSILSRP